MKRTSDHPEKYLTVREFLEDIEKQIDEKCNSYANYTYILVLLDLMKTRLYHTEIELSQYCGNLIKKILDKSKKGE